MRNDGTDLELLVQKIEAQLVPEGFKVEARHRVFEEGIQMAEFDLVIIGKLGSVPVKYLIECRDRPSGGPQGGQWIQTLVGRRALFKFDSVVAVSTSGFAESAKMLAADAGIHLRTVRTGEDLAQIISWAPITLANPLFKTVGVVELVPAFKKDEEFLSGLQTSHPGDISVRELTSFKPARFYDFVWNNLPKSFDRDSNGVRYCNLSVRRPLELIIGEKSILIREMSTRICFSQGQIQGKAIALREYTGNGQTIGQEILVRFDAPAGSIECSFAVAVREDTYSLDLLDFKWPTGRERP